MIKIALAFSILFSANLLAKGIGGIAGGTDKYQKGSHIQFQKESIYVHTLYSKTLCHDGHDYEALVKQCVEWERDDGERKCVRHEYIKAYQPINSQRERCNKKDDNGDCISFITVPFYQSPNRLVEIENPFDKDEIQIKRVTVPTCSYAR